MLHFTKKRAVIGAAIATLAMGAVAFAFFTSTGNGSGTATVGTSTAWEVTTAAATGGPLTPNGPTQTIGYTVKNNSSGVQSLANVAIQVADTGALGAPTPWTFGTGPNACTRNDFAIDGALPGATVNDTAPAASIPAGGTATGTITIQMVETTLNQDQCKNAPVHLHLAAS